MKKKENCDECNNRFVAGVILGLIIMGLIVTAFITPPASQWDECYFESQGNTEIDDGQGNLIPVKAFITVCPLKNSENP